MYVLDFIRIRYIWFVFGLCYLEFCLEYKRRFDSRFEIVEVFFEGVLVVMDDSVLMNDEDVLY